MRSRKKKGTLSVNKLYPKSLLKGKEEKYTLTESGNKTNKKSTNKVTPKFFLSKSTKEKSNAPSSVAPK